MSISKGWNWKIVEANDDCIWKNPSIESFYLLNRWKATRKLDFLDLGCGLGRHSILFGQNDFNVHCFDISEDAITSTKQWAEIEGLKLDYTVGDMLQLPYANASFDAMLCRNVISHSDTNGVKQIISEIYRTLRPGGECYLTLGSKETWGWKQTNWPQIDANTRLRMEPGPEYKTPHFYADYKLCQELFNDFKILQIYQIEDFYEDNGKTFESWHWHLLIKKP